MTVAVSGFAVPGPLGVVGAAASLGYAVAFEFAIVAVEFVRAVVVAQLTGTAELVQNSLLMADVESEASRR
jgi:hypothetical protein